MGNFKLNENGLSSRQQIFCDEYLANKQNGEKAYRTAYGNIKTARFLASRLLTKDNIKTYIDKELAGLQQQTQEKGLDVIKTLQELATIDLSQMYEETEEEVVKELPNGGNLTFLNKVMKPKPEYMKFFNLKIVNGKGIWQIRDKDKAIELYAKITGLMIDSKKIEMSGTMTVEASDRLINAADKLAKALEILKNK